ncbi:hypothetical protein KO116_03516 [Halomonas sp. KO116]|nr:hypothetical protein KO116_03516 [Halomonas sp. KO116]
MPLLGFRENDASVRRLLPLRESHWAASCAANQFWSMFFVFGLTADRRVIENLTVVVDDAAHESVAIVPERTIGGLALTRVLDHLALQRGLPNSIRTDNVKEFCGRTMLS